MTSGSDDAVVSETASLKDTVKTLMGDREAFSETALLKDTISVVLDSGNPEDISDPRQWAALGVIKNHQDGLTKNLVPIIIKVLYGDKMGTAKAYNQLRAYLYGQGK
jgi:hypothetical protein